MRRERRRSHPPMGTALCMAETVAREWNQSIANPTFCCVVRCSPAKGRRLKWASASLTQQSLRFVMINRTPRESLSATARSA